MSQPLTKPGRLSDVARHVVIPDGIVSTGWPAVRDRCADFGVGFDSWQDGAGRVILSKLPDGSYACSVGGVVISIPRQVGKTFLIGAIVFALCLLNPGLTVVWTAHHTTTANETFVAMQGFARRKKVRPHVDKVMIDAATVSFVNGSRIMFGARERGFGRGMAKVGVLVFDEAQILTERAAADMVPTTNTVANALVIYTGTPPKPTDPSEVFTNRRVEALSGDAEGMAYIEFGADPDAKPDDRKQWAKANPSYPHRTNTAAMLRMKKNLAPDSFRREALGIWDEIKVAAAAVFEGDAWARLAVEAAPPRGRPAYGVKFATDGRTVALAGSLRPVSGPVHVEGIDHRLMAEGTRWLVEFLAARWKGCAKIAVDGRAGAGALVQDLREAGVPASKIVLVNAEQAVTAHAAMLQAVTGRTVTHPDDPALELARAAAVKRPIGTTGGWGLQSHDGADITLLEAVVLAHYAAPKPKREGAGAGRMLVMT